MAKTEKKTREPKQTKAPRKRTAKGAALAPVEVVEVESPRGEATEIVCSITQLPGKAYVGKTGEAKLPRGWKRIGGALYSPEGYKQACYCRVTTGHVCLAELLPLSRKSESYPDALLARSRADWALAELSRRGVVPLEGKQAKRHDMGILEDVLRELSRQCARAANVCVAGLFVLDAAPTVPKAGGFALGKYPTLTKEQTAEIDRAMREAAPDVDSQTRYSLRNKVQAKYLQERFDTRLRCVRSVPSFRDGIPVPVRSYDVDFHVEGEEVALDLRLHGLHPCLRMRLWLAGNPKNFGREMVAFRAAALAKREGQPIHGELSLRFNDRGRILAGLAIHHRRTDANVQRPEKHVWLETTDDALLVAYFRGRDARSADDRGSRAFRIVGHDLLGRVQQHQRRVQGFGDDRKADKRPSRKKRSFERACEQVCARHQRFVGDRLHHISRQAVDFLRRVGATHVLYDDSNKSYMGEKFPYFALKQKLQDKLQQTHESGSAKRTDRPLAYRIAFEEVAPVAADAAQAAES